MMKDSPSILSFFARVLEVTSVLIGAAARLLYRKMRGRPTQGPELIRQLFEGLGGSFIKFGQILSLQIDTLPREYCDALLALLDRVPPFPREQVEQIFLETLRRLPTRSLPALRL